MNFDRLSKQALQVRCESLGIETRSKRKSDLKEALVQYEKDAIDSAIANGTSLELLKRKLNDLADSYAQTLNQKVEDRKREMDADDNAHYLIYRVFGISRENGRLIDEYQNTGRFLYKYAGSFLEEAATLCLLFSDRDGCKTLVQNTLGARPKTFEIDFLTKNNAIELKWRDATTDGDHITKEHTRIKVIESYGYKPIRVMFYYPQRTQAIKIQETLRTIYAGVNGEYYAGEEAWQYLKTVSGYDLQAMLEEIAERRDSEANGNQ